MCKVLAVDLDGTLFYPKQLRRCIPKKNVKFLQKWIDSGNRLVLITSRGEEFVERLKSEIDRPFDYMPCTSSQVFIDGKLVRDITIPRQTVQEVLKQVNRQIAPIAFMITTRKYPLLVRNNRNFSNFIVFFFKIWWFFQFKYREKYTLNNKEYKVEINEGDVYKVMVFCGFGKKKIRLAKELNKAFRDQYPDVEFSWTKVVNEITPKGASKGEGLQFYLNYLGIRKEDAYVVGDSGNDIAMFRKFHENSFCMKHSGKVVSKYAAHVIKRVYNLDKYLFTKENN